MRTLRRLCELQLYALLFALPFEYYFRGRDQTLYTSLKLQLLLLMTTWMFIMSAEALGSGGAVWAELKRSLSGRLLLATFLFVLVQGLAAALAPEYRGNAVKAAVKAGLGALLLLIAADLSPGFRPRSSEMKYPVLNSLCALSLSGTCVALLGFGALAGINAFEHVVHLFQSSRYFLGNRIRFVATMEYPNTAGSFLCAAICASLALAVFQSSDSPRRRKALWLVQAAAQGLALSLTYSRGAMVSTMIAITVTTWILRGHIGKEYKKTAGAICLAALLGGTAGLFLAPQRDEREGTPAGRRLARYGAQANEEVKYLLANHAYAEMITVENASSFPWRGGAYGVAYRWYSLSTDEAAPMLVGAEFPADVGPAKPVKLPVSLTTPSLEGEYLLIWFVFHRTNNIQELKDSYSPAVLCSIGSTSSASSKGLSDKARRFLDAIREERRDLSMIPLPRRSELWPAALRMFRHRPLLGIGPDNFRLLKWKYMEIPKGDETILANNLCLEVLSGSGVFGLVSFLWLLWEFGRNLSMKVAAARSSSQWTASCFGVAYFVAFLVHGLVDYFLKFTPIFLLFWLTLGMLSAREPEAGETDANRL